MPTLRRISDSEKNVGELCTSRSGDFFFTISAGCKRCYFDSRGGCSEASCSAIDLAFDEEDYDDDDDDSDCNYMPVAFIKLQRRV